MTEASRVLTCQRVIGWEIARSFGSPRRVGEMMYREAEDIAAKVADELATQRPDHLLDWRNAVLEIRIQYLVPED